jgi:hypothetical protein
MTTTLLRPAPSTSTYYPTRISTTKHFVNKTFGFFFPFSFNSDTGGLGEKTVEKVYTVYKITKTSANGSLTNLTGDQKKP